MKTRPLSLERKLNLILFASMAAALALASSALVFMATRQARQRSEASLTALANLVGHNSQNALQNSQFEEGVQVLSTLAETPAIDAAQLYDGAGNPFAQFLRDDAQPPRMPSTAPNQSAPWTDQDHLWVTAAIERDNQQIGTALLGAPLAPARQALHRQILQAILVALLSILPAVLLGSLLLRLLLKPVHRMLDSAQSLAAGNLPDELPVAVLDEIGELQTAFNQIAAASREMVRQTQTLARGDFSISLRPRSHQDELSHALVDMATKLKTFHEESLSLSAVKSGLSLLNDQMSGEPDLGSLLDHILAAVVKNTRALAGAIYLVRGPQQLEMAAGFSLEPPKDATANRILGQGIVGQVAAERRFRIVSGNNREFLPLHVGLLDCPLREIALTPLVHDEVLVGVLELGSLDGFDAHHREFLQQAAASIAIAIHSAQSRNRLDELLNETREQADELRERQIALQNSNRDLEERNLLLEVQKEAIRHQKETLENTQLDLERKARELETTSRYKSEFMANMSHELRTPLNSMLILSRLLSENKTGNLTPKQIEFAQSVHKAGSDLLNLINEILDLSKLESDNLPLHFLPASIHSIVESLNAIYKPLALDKGLAFNLATSPDAPETLLTDGQRVGQILRNLLGNAFKFTPKGHVVLRIRPPTPDERQTADAAIAFAIEDTGIGIPPEKHKLIFQAFRQADGTTTRQYGGTGLGLSISLELARRLGGDIRLESKEGQGSTFTLLLPAAPAKPTQAPIEPATPAAPLPAPVAAIAFADDRACLDAEHRTLLVVDDDLSFNQVVAEFARERNYRILCAADGDEGLQLARAHRPYGLLLDMMLPHTDGHTVLQQLKADEATRTIPVFVISALDHDQEMLRLGAIGFLTKPVSSQDLDLAIRRFEWIRSRTKKNLLVVDDDPGEILAVEELLADWPVHVHGCATGAEALRLSKTSEFDAILLDWGLEDMSGREVIESLEPTHPAACIPIILYTGRDLTREEEASVRRKAVGVVAKGDASSRLLDKLALILHLPRPAPPTKSMPPVQTAVPAAPPATPSAPAVAPAANALAGLRILVVDDDMRSLYSLSSNLDRVGAESLSASNGPNALDLLEQNRDVHLVLMDLQMPEMDGFQAIREIRSRPSIQRVPILAMLDKGAPDSCEAALAAGANDSLAKPIDLAQLALAAQKWIRK